MSWTTNAFWGGAIAGAIAGAIVGAIVAIALQKAPAIPFPPGATEDYLCSALPGRDGNLPEDYSGAIPPKTNGKKNKCPHENPCNNIGSAHQLKLCEDRLKNQG